MGVLNRAKAMVLDTWANLTYKRAFLNPHRYAGSWVPPTDLRRLTAYRVLAAYRDNVAREHLPAEDSAQREHREYGDAELIVHRVVSGILGDDMQIVVDDADNEPPDTPTMPAAPVQPADGASDIDRQVHEATVRVWEERATEAIAAWEEAWANLPTLRERQEWLRDWADGELFEQAVWECEGDVVTLGDGLYTLEVSTDEQRVKLDVYDPGFYFPVLDEAAHARGFPTTIHIAFELDLNNDGAPDHVRRITYELGAIQPLTVMTPDGPVPAVSETVVDPDVGEVARTRPIVPGESPSLMEQDSRRADGHIVRRYPWAQDEDSLTTCYKTDAVWRLDDVAGKTVYEFPLDARYATYAMNEQFDQIRRLDLRQDFIPAVHIPNTPSRRDHFGKSTLARVLQLLDDLAETDSDVQRAAALAGSPMVALSGDQVAGEITIRPGIVFNVGANGRMDTVDLSQPLLALLDVKGNLEDRLGVNVQVPGEVTGRTEASGAESGFAKVMKLGPYSSLILLLRLVREPKYRLLLKFVQRMSQTAGFLDPGPTLTARVAFGSFLPSDRQAAIEEIVALMSSKPALISRRTALQMLVDVGIDIGDLAEELARIDAEDVAGARELFEATGDQELVNARLGVKTDPAKTVEPPADAADPAAARPVPDLPAV